MNIVSILFYNFVEFILLLYTFQGRSQNLKEVPQNFTEAFSVDGVTHNDVIQRNQHRKEKKITLNSIVITDVK